MAEWLGHSTALLFQARNEKYVLPVVYLAQKVKEKKYTVSCSFCHLPPAFFDDVIEQTQPLMP